MFELFQVFAVALREVFTAGQNAKRQEEALMRAEERLALMRKRARFKNDSRN